MLDSIIWGNPTQEDFPFIEAESPLNKHFSQLIKFSFPKNSSKATREELNQLVDQLQALNENPEIMVRYKAYDTDLERFLAKVIIDNKLGEKAAAMADRLLDETKPLIYKLKYHFQRPRPYQLAAAYKLKLFPYNSVSANNPSYPSSHTLQSALVFYVLGNHFPHLFEYFDSLIKDITYSRQFMGLAYQSDIDFAQYCVEWITRDKEFKAAYQL